MNTENGGGSAENAKEESKDLAQAPTVNAASENTGINAAENGFVTQSPEPAAAPVADEKQPETATAE
jgi:hypothetical protein